MLLGPARLAVLGNTSSVAISCLFMVNGATKNSVRILSLFYFSSSGRHFGGGGGGAPMWGHSYSAILQRLSEIIGGGGGLAPVTVCLLSSCSFSFHLLFLISFFRVTFYLPMVTMYTLDLML